MAKKGNSSAPAKSSGPARSTAPARASAPTPKAASISSAKTAASTGEFTKANAQDLRQAGVSQNRIQNIRSQSQQINQRNTTAAAATTGNSNVNSAIDAQFNGGFNIGRDFYNSPGFQSVLGQNLNADGTKMSEAQVAKYAMDKGYGLGDKYMAEFGTSSAPRKAANIRQAIKIAAANDPLNILTSKEAKGIYSDYQNKKNLDALKFTGILDRMNTNFDKRGYQSIGLGGGALNYLFNNMDGMSQYRQMLNGIPSKGLSSVLMGMGDSWKSGGAGDGASTYKVPGTGKFNRGDTIYGQYSTGQFKDSPGLGRSWKDSKWGTPETVTYQPFATPTGEGEAAPVVEVPTLPEEEKDKETPGSNQFGAGADLSSFATGWKSKRGLRANAGRGAQGFASMRIAPSYASGIGTNYG